MKVLIVGLGSIAQKHLTAINKLFPACEIMALRSGKSNRNINGVKNIDKFENIPDSIDFSIICNPTSEHEKTIRLLAELGKPIIIEKPVLASLDEANELNNFIESKNLMTYVACNLRFHPVIERLKEEFLRRKPIEMNVYCGSYLPDWRPNIDYREIYSAQTALGGGVHLDLIHELDYSIYLMGKPIEVQSYKSKKSGLEINTKDIAHYVLEYPSSSVFITMNYYRGKAKREIECVWDNDVWSADLIEGKIIDGKGEEVFSCNFDIMDTYEKQLTYFWQSVKKNQTPMNDFKEAIKTLEVCLN